MTGLERRDVRRLRELHGAEGRSAQRSFLAEGRRLIDDLIARGWAPRLAVVRDDLEVPAAWDAAVVCRCDGATAARISQASTPSGYLAEFALPAPAVLDPQAGGLVLVGVHDPGNLGTLLRSAAAFGLPQVLLLGGADPFGAKAVQASAGALAAVRLVRGEGVESLVSIAGGAPLLGLVVTGGEPPPRWPPPPLWLAVGSEAHGLPPAILARCRPATLPMPGGTESLNAAVAGSIAAYLAAVR